MKQNLLGVRREKVLNSLLNSLWLCKEKRLAFFRIISLLLSYRFWLLEQTNRSLKRVTSDVLANNPCRVVHRWCHNYVAYRLLFPVPWWRGRRGLKFTNTSAVSVFGAHIPVFPQSSFGCLLLCCAPFFFRLLHFLLWPCLGVWFWRGHCILWIGGTVSVFLFWQWWDLRNDR